MAGLHASRKPLAYLDTDLRGLAVLGTVYSRCKEGFEGHWLLACTTRDPSCTARVTQPSAYRSSRLSHPKMLMSRWSGSWASDMVQTFACAAGGGGGSDGGEAGSATDAAR